MPNTNNDNLSHSIATATHSTNLTDYKNLCTLTLLGNLVANPVIRYQVNPIVAIAELTLATHSRWLDKATNQYKEWTQFHTVKVIGKIVERTLIHAQKGDVILIKGYLLNSKKTAREIIHASFAQTFNNGYAQSINQVQCSAYLSQPIQLVRTEKNKELAEAVVTIHHQVFSSVNQSIQNYSVTRPIHIWGKQGRYLHEHAKIGDELVIDGKLNYLKNNEKSQFIDAKQVVLLKD